MRRAAHLLFVVTLSVGFLGCEYVRPTLNAPLAQWDPHYGYRYNNLAPPEEGNSDGLFMVASFSGGGTRASTLAFGALRVLARQHITWEGRDKRLLDELDVIYALSGGTFTGAYYALFGERIFHDFEYRFLRKDWETELRHRILRSPSNWLRLWSPYFGRIHIMSELLDEALYDGKTYGDLLNQKTRPGLLIHASDMATLSRFEFGQVQFDMLCSDLSQLPIAYASAASAALPLVLSPITLKNYAGSCGYRPPDWLETAAGSSKPVARQRAKELLSYLDVEKRPQIHLLDGGLSDNMALRGILEGSAAAGGLDRAIKNAGAKKVKKLVFVAVNAETSPDVREYRSDHIPSTSRVFSALVDIPINRYSSDTLALMRMGVEKWHEKLSARKVASAGRVLRGGPEDADDSPFTEDADVYFIDVSLGAVADVEEQQYLMKIPTTLYLTDEQIERLLSAATKLIHRDPEFQRLMRDFAVDIDGAMDHPATAVAKEDTMMRWKNSLLLVTATAFSLLTVTGFLGAKGDSPKEKRENIRSMQRQALADLYKEKPSVKARLEKAAGYAVFSNMNVKLFMVGSGNGYGVAVDNATKQEIFMKMMEVGGGMGFGVSDLRAVMIFHEKEDFKKFVETGIEFSGKAGAEAQSGDQGMAMRQEQKLAGAGEKDVQLFQGVEVYQMTKNGLMGQAMLYGTKYWKDDELN